MVAKSWDHCNSLEVTKFCQNVSYKSFFGRVFRKSPKFKVADNKLIAAIKNDEKVPVTKSVADDKIPLLDSVNASILNLTDEVALLTDEVQAVKTTLKKDKKAAKNENAK